MEKQFKFLFTNTETYHSVEIQAPTYWQAHRELVKQKGEDYDYSWDAAIVCDCGNPGPKELCKFDCFGRKH